MKRLIKFAVVPFYYFILAWPGHQIISTPNLNESPLPKQATIQQFGPFGDIDVCRQTESRLVVLLAHGSIPIDCWSDQPDASPTP